MTDPTIVTLDDYPDPDRDRYWVRENLEKAEASLAKIPNHFTDAVVDVDAVRDWVRSLVEHSVARRLTVPAVTSGPSLLLLGWTGTGKTHQAYGVIRALAMTGLRVAWKFSTAADIYASLRPRPNVDAETVFLEYARASLLVIDDLGAAKSSEWNEEINYRLINHRYEHELPTLITSNVPPKQLREVLGERVTSRLVEMTTRVVLDGPDRRRGKDAA